MVQGRARVAHAVVECRRHLAELAAGGLALDEVEAAELRELVDAVAPARGTSRRGTSGRALRARAAAAEASE